MKNDDGIIKYRNHGGRVGPCSNCQEETLVLMLKEVNLPEGIEPSHKLIVFEQSPVDPGYAMIKQIGIGCGCYGKFHRQIAHIQDRKKG